MGIGLTALSLVFGWVVGTLNTRSKAKEKELKQQVKAHEIRNEVEAGIDAGDAKRGLREQWMRRVETDKDG